MFSCECCFEKCVVLVQLVFRIYVESMWYPGRQLNAMQLVKQTLKSSSPEDDSSLSPSVSSSSIVHAKDTTSLTDVVQPPKVITVRHITNVFQKLGYDIDLGAQLFDILCEKAKKLRRGEVRALTGSVPLPSSIPRVVSEGCVWYFWELSHFFFFCHVCRAGWTEKRLKAVCTTVSSPPPSPPSSVAQRP